MYRKCMILLLTGLLLAGVGCGNTPNMSNSEETTEESAVDLSTADSDSDKVNSEIITNLENELDEDAIAFESSSLSCVLPKGFKPHAGEEGLYVYKNYPTDISTISYLISESETDITQMTEAEYKTKLEAGYLQDYGDKVEINITQYEKIEIDGRKALRVIMDYEFKGIEYEQLVYMIYNSVESHILNYTQEKDGKWMEAFMKSGDSITFID